MSKANGQFHYAIKALEARLTKIMKKPYKFTDVAQRLESINEAITLLRINSVPVSTYSASDVIKAV